MGARFSNWNYVVVIVASNKISKVYQIQ